MVGDSELLQLWECKGAAPRGGQDDRQVAVLNCELLELLESCRAAPPGGSEPYTEVFCIVRLSNLEKPWPHNGGRVPVKYWALLYFGFYL